MKRLIISLAAAITAIAGMSASTAAPDSIIQIDNARRVTVTDIDGTVAISVECPDTTLTFTHAAARSHSVRSGSGLFSSRLLRSNAKRSDQGTDWIIGSVSMGVTGAPGAQINIEPAKSFEISMLMFPGIRHYAGNEAFSIGLGYTWRNYRSTTGQRFVKTGDNSIGIDAFPEGVTPRMSRLHTFSLQLPMMYEHTFPCHVYNTRFMIGAGIIPAYNAYGSIKTTWTDADGHRDKDFHRGVGLRKFSVDFMVMMRVSSGLGVFFRYSPCDVLQGSSPRFKSWTAGAALLL
ncbi:MAG: hypothetical protein K2L66_05850 [Paramuribaculum sp.]|nr:hypothetical protein [Paramuribaculum sp.]